MKDLRQKLVVLSVSVLLALAGAFAAAHRTPPAGHSNETNSTNRTTEEKEPIQTQTSDSITPQAIGRIDPHVIGGGGGTSAGGNIRVDGTIGEVSASNAMSGGTFTLNGGFWNALAGAGASSSPSPTPSPSPSGSPSPSPSPQPPNVVQFNSSNYNVQEDCTSVTITVTRIGDTSGAASVDYNTSDVSATERRDYITTLGRLSFAASETSKSFVVLVNEDSFVEGNETFNLNLSNPSGVSLGGPAISTVTITDDSSEPAANPIDDPRNYVCQHYHDFLNRQPDQSGWDFWTNDITSCGADPQCLEVKRVNVSAAFYLSIEFQQTGYLVERSYKTAYGDATGNSTFGGAHQLAVPIIRANEFLADTQQITKGVIVLQPGWEQVLENNKQAFFAEFVQRSRFVIALPTSMTPAAFVDTLNTNAGNPLSQPERDQLVNSLTSGALTRAQVLRAVSEDSDLNSAEFNRAFVLMQYLGYLRRNPNDPQDTDYTGFDFWLTKLNNFTQPGDNVLVRVQNAEMVKAFIISSEYRRRFGP